MSLFQTDHCLYCYNPIDPIISWESFFLGGEKQLLCQKCASQLEKINGAVCKICGRPFDKLEEQYRQNELCNDCVRWESSTKWQGILEKNISIFIYNDFMAELIARYKYRGDYELAKIFAEDIKQAVKQLKYDLIVPIPLSDERLYERGFNQAESLAIEAGLSITNLLSRHHSEKQSKKSREERIHLKQVFKLRQEPKIERKSILLIDDIYTTGSTIRHAALRLKQAGAKSIISLTIARG